MAMTFYSGWQWLLIDAATQYGLDKLTFEERIYWATTNLHELETLADNADSKPLYLKAVMAIRKAQAGLPTGHMVGVDGCCSGIQMMSVLTGCEAGAKATGLVDSSKRADAYSECTEEMNQILGNTVTVTRSDAKSALMKAYYGSTKEPKKIFGEATRELEAFYQAARAIAPGAWELLQVLLNSWRPDTLMHHWVLPDGFDARIKVMVKKQARIEIDELEHASFTYQYYDNEGLKNGLSNAANVTHSVDAYVLRCMHRRCNYDRKLVEQAAALLQMALIERSMGTGLPVKPCPKVTYYIEHFDRSGLADVVILPYLTQDNIHMLSKVHLQRLVSIINGMLQYKPFELVTIHDEFKAHPNNVNWVRYQYKEILAEIAESNLLSDLLSQLYERSIQVNKRSPNLGAVIRQSAYGLC